MRKIGNIVEKYLCIIIFLLLIILLIVSGLQIFSRIIGSPLIWTEEVSRILLIWMVFIGATIGVKRNKHFVVDIIVSNISGYPHKILSYFIDICILITNIVFMIIGIKFVQIGFKSVSAITRISMGWIYLIVPISGLIMGIFIILSHISELEKKQLNEIDREASKLEQL